MDNTTHPDELLFAKLVTLFPEAQVGVAPLVYHSPGGDPIPCYLAYKRTGTDTERDLAGNPMVLRVDYDVECSSMFFHQVENNMVAIDNYSATDANGKRWDFNLSNETINELGADEFSITYSLTAIAAV